MSLEFLRRRADNNPQIRSYQICGLIFTGALQKKEFVKKMLKEKIKRFLETEDEDYFSFIRTLTERKANPFANTINSKDFEDFWYPRKYMSKVTGRNCNIFFNTTEIDFTKFSWSFLKLYTKDDELIKVMNAISELNDELTDNHQQFRIKRLRIHLFTTMNYVGSPFFDVEVYKKCLEGMYASMKKLNEYLADKVQIISTTYDSVMFIGVVDYDDIRKYVAPADFKVRNFEMVIHFRNILATKMKGEWRLKKITGTNYDDLKTNVVELLKELKFGDAIMLLNKSDLNEKTKPQYIKDVVLCKKECQVA